jgi:hypothetical protein
MKSRSFNSHKFLIAVHQVNEEDLFFQLQHFWFANKTLDDIFDATHSEIDGGEGWGDF